MPLKSTQAPDEWARRWLDPVARGTSTMSRRRLSTVEQQGGGVSNVATVARELGVHLLQLTDDEGNALVAASRHPFKVLT